MANSQQPTKRTRHMDIKAFALQDWVETDLLILKRINTVDNESDCLTKPTDRTLFYRHTEYIMDKVKPQYTETSRDKPHINCLYSSLPIKVISEHGRVSYVEVR